MIDFIELVNVNSVKNSTSSVNLNSKIPSLKDSIAAPQGKLSRILSSFPPCSSPVLESKGPTFLEDCKIGPGGELFTLGGDCNKSCPDDKVMTYMVDDSNNAECCCSS